MAGGGTIPIEAAGLAVGAAIRRPADLPFRHLAAFAGLPTETPDLFPGTVPRILALDADAERIPAMVGNLRAAGLTGRAYEDAIVIGQRDVRSADAGRSSPRLLPRLRGHGAGRLLLQPALRRAHRRRGRRRDALLDLYADMGRALARFSGLARRVFRREPRLRGGLRPRADHDEAGDQRRAAWRVPSLSALAGAGQWPVPGGMPARAALDSSIKVFFAGETSFQTAVLRGHWTSAKLTITLPAASATYCLPSIA